MVQNWEKIPRILLRGPGPKVGHLESPDMVQMDPRIDPASLIRSKRGITLDNTMHSLEVTANPFF